MSTETILIYEDIGYIDWWTGEGLTAASFVQSLNNAAAKSNDIEIRINSLGGLVSDGIAIYNQIRAMIHRKNMLGVTDFSVKTIVDGFAYSSAATIAMAGTKVIMNKGSSLMIHPASSGLWGTAKALRKEADVLDMFTEQISEFYSDKSGKKKADMMSLMDAETYFTPAEALSMGLCDQVDESKDAATNIKRFDSVKEDLVKCRNHQMDYGSFYRDYAKSRAIANRASTPEKTKVPIDNKVKFGYNPLDIELLLN